MSNRVSRKEIEQLTRDIEALNRTIDAWENGTLSQYLRLTPGTHTLNELMVHFGVSRQRVHQVYMAMRRDGWTVDNDGHGAWRTIPPIVPIAKRKRSSEHPVTYDGNAGNLVREYGLSQGLVDAALRLPKTKWKSK